MKQRRVWRYTCDHCGKSGCHSGHMRRHESACTANPNRECRMCRMLDFKQKPITELVAVLTGVNDENADEKLEQLRAAANHCPACMLAAIRQSQCGIPFDFSFKRECASFWRDFNITTVGD